MTRRALSVNCISKLNDQNTNLQTGNAGLEHGNREADDREDVEHVEGAGGEVGEVQHRVEQLIAWTEEHKHTSSSTFVLRVIVTRAHGEEDPPVSVVELHPVVARGVDELVAGGALQQRGVNVEPVAGDVDGHGELEEEHGPGVEGGEGGQQAHGGAPVRQHVEHRTELAALPQQPRRVPVHRVQQAWPLSRCVIVVFSFNCEVGLYFLAAKAAQ